MNLVEHLTEDDRRFLAEQKHSAHFRVFQKAINYFYLLECAKLPTVEPALLMRTQGVLQGLTLAKNLLALGFVDDNKKR